MNNSIIKIRDIISKYDDILITGHVSPDGDAIGACCALGMALKNMGKTPTIYLEDFSETFNIIPSDGLIKNDTKDIIGADLFITLDCAGKDRIPQDIIRFANKCKSSINIDHHISNDFFGDYNYVVEKSSSASEIVYTILDGFIEINKNIAEAIYTGIIFDTGGLRHSSTSKDTLMIVADLLSYDIPFTNIYNTIFNSRNYVEAKLLGKALDNLNLAFDGRVSYTYLSLEEISKANGTSNDVNEIIDYIKGIKNTMVAIFLYEKKKGEFKVSLRSGDEINVSEVANVFGGGGHLRAAGCTLYGSMEEAIEKVLYEFEKLFQKGE